eukprot:jgi/Tetstr1/444273/TSEL_032165.t1
MEASASWRRYLLVLALFLLLLAPPCIADDDDGDGDDDGPDDDNSANPSSPLSPQETVKNQQKDILLAFSTSRMSVPGGRVASWPVDADLCTFGGVECNPEGQVTALYIGLNRITGSVPAEFSAFTGLTDLFLPVNDLTGTLPPQWSVLTQLRRLSVDSNRITGVVPPQWSALNALEQLSMANNQLSGNLTSQLGAITGLKQLSTSNNMFTGQLPVPWSTLTAITSMDLSDNAFSGGLPESWSVLGALTNLNVAGNQLTGGVPEQYSAMSSLTQLNVTNNALQGFVPSALGYVSVIGLEMAMPGVDFNVTTAPTPATIDPTVEQQMGLLLQVQVLMGGLASWSPATDMCTQWVGVTCGSEGTVTSLDLSNSGLRGATLPVQIGFLTSLRQLDLSNNELVGSLPEQWSALSNLTELNLSSNQLIGELPEQWSAMSSLQSMNVAGNYITGVTPSSFGFPVQGLLEDRQPVQMPADQKSVLAAWAQSAGGLPPSWSSASDMCTAWEGVTCDSAGYVAELNVSGQDMRGKLPTSMSGLASLKQMNMSNNTFDGGLPAVWSALKGLQTMCDLGNNLLTGPLPPGVECDEQLARL